MKKLIAVILILCLSVMLLASCGETPAEPSDTTKITPAYQDTFDNLNYDYKVYSVSNGDEEIVGVAVSKWRDDKAAESITIQPTYVYGGKTYPVIHVGTGGCILNFQSTVQSVTIPSSVSTIGANAFSMCTALSAVNFSEGLETIMKAAFWGCVSLESVTLPSTVKKISKSAFSSCEKLTTLTIPTGVETIEDNAFAGCNSLTSVTISRKFESRITAIFPDSPNAVFTFVD